MRWFDLKQEMDPHYCFRVAKNKFITLNTLPGTKTSVSLNFKKTSVSFAFNDKVQPISLPHKGEEFYKNGDSAQLTGWGATESESHFSYSVFSSTRGYVSI